MLCNLCTNLSGRQRAYKSHFWTKVHKTFRIFYLNATVTGKSEYLSLLINFFFVIMFISHSHDFPKVVQNDIRAIPGLRNACRTSICTVLYGSLWLSLEKMKPGYQRGRSFFMFHDHNVTLLLHYF